MECKKYATKQENDKPNDPKPFFTNKNESPMNMEAQIMLKPRPCHAFPLLTIEIPTTVEKDEKTLEHTNIINVSLLLKS